MSNNLEWISPKIKPPLDDGFRPASLIYLKFEEDSTRVGVPLIIALERANGKISNYTAHVFPDDHSRASDNLYYAERMLKFLLWQRGGDKIYIAGPVSLAKYLQDCYSPNGIRKFDNLFMSERVYQKPLEVCLCEPWQIPPPNDTGKPLGRHLDGCRIGFDLGASDRKVSALIDGRVVYSEEVIWDPRSHSDPEYHYHEILKGIRTAASKLPHVDAIGGSSAGIFIDNRPMIASLFRSVPLQRYDEIRNLFIRIKDEMNVPLEVINDGDVTALAGSMSLEDNGILGIAMGSSLAAGYIDMQGHITGWLNELAFAPVDYNQLAPVDEWSGDVGCGAQYLSQQCIFRLAPHAGIDIPSDLVDAEKLLFVQERLNAGHPGAVKIWRSMGTYLGYSLAQYARFYDFKHVIILGRCTSGIGGTLILDEAIQVLEIEFPQIASQIKVQLPDEHSRRVGQAIAAASLPIISRDNSQS